MAINRIGNNLPQGTGDMYKALYFTYIIFPLIFLEATIWIKIFYTLIKYTNVTNLEGIVSMQNDRKGPIELNRLDQIV